MKIFIKNLCAVIFISVIAVILTVSVTFGIKNIPVPELVTETTDSGEELSVYSIYNMGSLNSLRYAYYTPDEFLKLSDEGLTGSPIDLNSYDSIAQRGTYKFVIMNLNPFDENYDEKNASLAPFLQDDNYWHFTVCLPPCFSACCVYVRSVLVNHAGSIKNYDYIYYSEKQGISEKHTDGTEPFILDLKFYTQRVGSGSSFGQRACIITVHYESEQGKEAGLVCAPTIGQHSSVTKLLSNDKYLLTIISVVGLNVFAVLIFACFLKRSPFALPQVFTALGVSGYSFFKLLMCYGTSAPYFLRAMVPVCVAIIAVSAILSLLYALKTQKTELFTVPPVVITFIFAHSFMPTITPVMFTPSIWLTVLILCLVTYSEFTFFIEQEKRNVYLTNNLQQEVALKTEDLKNIIDERDKLLRFLSHDMKKPIMSAQRFITEIKKNEENGENIKALNVIENKLEGVRDGLAELQKFAKLNFSAEESEVLNIRALFEDILPRIEPDCEASGIILSYSSPNISVYAKKHTFESVLQNIVFNAIEHADCKQIKVSAVKHRNKCRIYVKDDGKGIDGGRDVFLPYYTENSDGENLGLGLYICRQHMLSMNGDLEYSCESDKTVFTITLPLA